jgi:hypothetical protein
MTRWLELDLPTIKRISFAGKLIQRMPDRDSGYRRIAEYLPDVRLDPESTDFLYRVNRKRLSNSGTPDLLINRLSTWSVMKVTVQARGRVPGSGEVIDAPSAEADVSKALKHFLFPCRRICADRIVSCPQPCLASFAQSNSRV